MQSASKVNILMVDDRPENLIALEAVLDGLGQNLIKAGSGEEALKCLLHQDFAVILLDVQMSGMDGFETAQLIRQRERTRNTPIIFLTAFSTSDSFVFKGYALGAVDYLLKPIDPVILNSKVAVFVELFKKTMEVKQQAIQLTTINSELKTSEQRFRSLSACAPTGIFLTDETGKCTYANPKCQEICGFKTEESWQKEWAAFIHDEDRERIITDWSQGIRTKQPYSGEFRINTPEGDLRWVHVRTSPMLSEQRHLLGQVGTIEDITERKLSEAFKEQMIREQAARAEAEAANRMKDEFLAILSHELRTPLSSILGWAKLLRTKKFDETTTNRALETIERNALSQGRLIEDILDISKITQGKMRLNLQPVSTIDAVETVIKGLQPQAEAKKISLKTNYCTHSAMIYGDPERMQQIIWNLIVNAIKFTPESGRIEVSISPLDEAGEPIATSDEQQTIPKSVRIQVIDTGVGISASFIPYVFERFRQADSSSTRTYNGLGLGLTIVSHLVELHKGKISVFSEGEGKGATFTVDLPLAKDIKSQDDSKTSHQLSTTDDKGMLSGLEVLLVEDNTDTRDYIKMVLEQSQAKVTAVGSAKEAMASLHRHIPDILVSDIAMPDEDGYQLIRRIRTWEKERGEKIPAIALTAYARLEERMEALAAGFQKHLAKPIEPTELIAAVAELLGILKEVSPPSAPSLQN